VTRDQGLDLQLQDLDRIGGAARHLLGLINDVLDLSKIEAGRMDVVRVSMSLSHIVDEVSGTLALMIEEHADTLAVEHAASLPSAMADATFVRQVLSNLLSNASKFTDSGDITVKTWAEGEWVYCSVSDTGIGISEEAQEKLFVPFEQGSAEMRGSFGGTGLGLTISRELCELMGGALTLESTEGEGSTFTVRLPVALEEEV